MKAILELCKSTGPSLDDVLLDEDSPAVQQYLGKSQQKEMKGWDSSTIDARRAAWQKVGKRWQASLPDDVDDKSPFFFQTLTAPEKDVIAYHRHVTPVGQGAQSKGVDVSQSITRRPCTKGAEDGRLLAPTIVPRSKIWLNLRKANTSVHRILVGKESLMIQGWPVDDARLEAFVDKHSNVFFAGFGRQRLSRNSHRSNSGGSVVCGRREGKPGSTEHDHIARGRGGSL